MKTDDNITQIQNQTQEHVLGQIIDFASTLFAEGPKWVRPVTNGLLDHLLLFTELDLNNQKKYLSVLEGLHEKKSSMQNEKPEELVKKNQSGTTTQE